MKNFFALTPFKTPDPVDFSPITNALESYRQQSNQNALMDMRRDETAYQRGRDQKQDARQDETFQQQRSEGLAKRMYAYSQLPREQRNPRTWQGLLQEHQKFHPGDGMDPDDLDPIKGPDIFAKSYAAAYGGLVKDPREDRLADIKLRTAEADLAKAQRGPTPEYKEVNGRLVEVGPNGAREVYAAPDAGDARLKNALEKEQFKIDLKTVNEYRQGSDNASDVLGSLDELEAARAETGREGPLLGWLPNVTPSAQRVDSAAENVRLGFVQKTKGAVSDAEMRVFGAATPTMSMSDAAAQPVLTGMRLANQRVQERSNFFDMWLRTRGSLQGAQEVWKRFTDENPILERDPKTKTYVPRPENVGGWQRYFEGNPAPSAAPQRQPNQQNQAPARAPIDVGDGFSVEVQ